MKVHTKLIALVLCIVMLIGMLPVGISAAEDAALQNINFMDPASADKFTIANQSATKINEGDGLYMVSTTDAFEPCNDRISSFSPKDVVSVPVKGDWTATIKFKFSQGSSQGYYEFFGFYAKSGTDYNNMVGLRAGDGAIQNFQSINGTIEADSHNSSAGLKSASSHWLRIKKVGDTYTGYWSTDGQNFTEVVSYEDTGIEASELILDAYSGMATGYTYNVEYLFFGDDNDLMNQYYLDTIIGSVLDRIPEVIPINVKDTYTLPKGAAGCTVTYSAEPNCIEGNKIVAMDKETKVKLTVNIATGGTSLESVLNVTVPAKGTGTTPVDTFTVTFNPNVSGMSSVEVKVDENDYVTVPESLSRVGYTATWRSGNTNFNFDTPITQNYTLTASWSKDWNQIYSLSEEYADYFPFGTFGSQSPGNGQTGREYCTFSGNSGKMTYNFGASESRNAYNAAVAEINADTSLTQEEKDAKILEADGKVMLGSNNPLQNDLNAIRNWNNQHPDEPKKYYRQHVIAWHGSEQNAAFYHEGFDTSKPLASKEVMNARLDSYIEAMFKRYQPWDDIILSWDIVNEALDDYNGMVRNGWNGSSWGETNLDDASNQSSAWGTIYRMKDEDGNPVMETSDERLMAESEWIRVAFASARKWQKELGVHWKLYYNDYMNSSMLYEPKMTNTLKMLKPIYEAGNIDGYGMQARLSTAYPDMELLRYQIEEGLKVADEVSFSEGDVRTDFEVNPLYDPDQPTRRVVSGDEEWDQGGSGSYSRRSQQNGNTYDVSNGPVRRKNNFNANDTETMRLQADYYADLMDIMLEKADLGKVGAIAIDGTRDNSTFNNGTGCQIWDSNGNEKPAFYAIIGASNRFKMGKAIEAGPAASAKSKYTAESWANYAVALQTAEDLVDVRIYDDKGVEAVKAATANLLAATEALQLASGASGLADIDFTNPLDSSKFDVINEKSAAIVEGEGLTLTTSRPAFETCNDRNSGEQATTPEDVIAVSVSGDWEATLEFDFNTASARNGYYQFFGFYASEGEDFQNLAGIRGGDGAMQNFTRIDGTIVADNNNSTPGLASNGTYWYRIDKDGTTYTCYRSADGEEFTEMFVYEDTGIEADQILIDAYTGMTEGYQFTLKSLTFEGGGVVCAHEFTSVVTAPTCTVGGYTTLTCSKCGKVKVTDKVAALGHDWDEGKVTVEPTETKSGLKVFTCKRCGEKKETKLLPTNLKEGPTVKKDPNSPTGYTVEFVYKNETATSVTFAGDIGLMNDADLSDTKQYAPSEYKPGLMRACSWTAPMEEISDGVWYIEVPMAAGANQYWFYVNGDTNTMVADPANSPIWSETSTKHNGYNAVYVPYDEKQAYEPLKARTAENPKDGSFTRHEIDELAEIAEANQMGTWSYVPVDMGNRIQYVGVYLPYGYDADRAEPYKTIYILHGGGQDECDWVGIGSVQNIMDNLLAEGRTEPAVIISPTTENNSLGGTSDNYANLFNVLIPFVEKNYNVSTDKMDRAFGGLSMGSMNTQNIINSSPVDADGNPVDKFGYYGPWSGGCSVSATAPGIEYAHILFAGGHNDFGDPDQSSIQALADQGVYCKYIGVTGAHDFNTWNQMFRIWLEEYLWNPAAHGDVTDPDTCEHDYKAVVTKPTCTEAGYTTYTCTKCGESYKADDVAALGHDFKDGVCTRCGEADPDYDPLAKFTDLPKKDNWAYKGIEYCVKKELMNGMSDTAFGPEGTLTRAQLVTILYRIANKPEVKFGDTFTDVKAGEWYSDAIEWAAANKIVEGIGNNKFDPMGNITREQIATILYRYEKYCTKEEPKVEGDLKEFPDYKDVSTYATEALAWAVDQELINGIGSQSETRLAPKENATRAQIAAIIMRYLEKA